MQKLKFITQAIIQIAIYKLYEYFDVSEPNIAAYYPMLFILVSITNKMAKKASL